jgi:hypothetical protein
MVEIRPLRDDELDWAAARYREIRFSPSPPGTRALVAELDGARVGLGRLVEHAPGVVELGGIWTAAFYETFGFEVARPPWPPPIAAKVAGLHDQHLPSIVVLVREPPG